MQSLCFALLIGTIVKGCAVAIRALLWKKVESRGSLVIIRTFLAYGHTGKAVRVSVINLQNHHLLYALIMGSSAEGDACF